MFVPVAPQVRGSKPMCFFFLPSQPKVFLLSEEQSDAMLQAPESGMGFQWVEVNFRQQIPQRGMVVNAAYLVLGKIESTELLHLENEVQRRGQVQSGIVGASSEIGSMRVLLPAEIEVLKRSTAPKNAPTLLSASAGAPTTLGQAIRFRRYSAFARDRRVTSGGGLLPGSFGTTEQDGLLHAGTGSAAVSRYALPNPSPAVHLFTITPPVSILLQWGVVLPAYGQPGGGVEVIFTHGSPANTVTGPVQIPP